MANSSLFEDAKEGETKDLAPTVPMKTSAERRRCTADEDEEEADRIMAELLKGCKSSSAIAIVKTEEEDDWDEEDEIGDREASFEKNNSADSTSSFNCSLCRRQFKQESTLNRHMSTFHPNGEIFRFICGQCGKGFAKRQHMEHHEATHGPRTAVCDLCPAIFASKDTLVIHKARDHKVTVDNQPLSPASTFPCQTCGQAFETKIQLRNHSYLCRRTKASKEKTAVAKRLLSKLEQPKDPKEPKEVTPCEECGKKFNSQYGKSRHIRKHHPQVAEQIDAEKNAHRQSLPHPCELCGKRFKLPRELKYHYMRHTGALNFRCDQCTCAYPLMSELKKHKARVHAGKVAANNNDPTTPVEDGLEIFY